MLQDSDGGFDVAKAGQAEFLKLSTEQSMWLESPSTPLQDSDGGFDASKQAKYTTARF